MFLPQMKMSLKTNCYLKTTDQILNLKIRMNRKLRRSRKMNHSPNPTMSFRMKTDRNLPMMSRKKRHCPTMMNLMSRTPKKNLMVRRNLNPYRYQRAGSTAASLMIRPHSH